MILYTIFHKRNDLRVDGEGRVELGILDGLN